MAFKIPFINSKKTKQQKSSILAVLEILKKGRTPLQIEGDQHLSSFIISEIDANKKQFTLLSLSPDNELGEIKKNQPFTLACLPNEIKNIQFSCRFVLAQTDVLNSYTFIIPDEIQDIERRNNSRARINVSADYQILINNSYGIPFSGRLEDISNFGMRVSFAQDLRQEINIGTTQRLCSIQICESETIECSSEVVYISYNSKKEQTLVGCKFIELNVSGQQALKKYIAEMQLKNYHRYL